jgi:hypothetical protein
MTVLSAEHGAVMAELERLISEERNSNTMDIDLLPTAEVLRVMNREDRSVADAVGRVIPEIARAVDSIVDAFAKGGRLIYLGAGTSGRFGGPRRRGMSRNLQCACRHSIGVDGWPRGRFLQIKRGRRGQC